AAVVDGTGVTNHLGYDGRTTRLRFDPALVAPAVHLDHLVHQVVVDERALLDRTRHVELAPSLSAAAHDHLVGWLRLAGPAFLLTPRADRMASAARLPLPATQGVVDGVHGHTSN